MASLQAALILRGADGLIGVARRLHQVTLGHRPFIALGRSECTEPTLTCALDGMLYVDADALAGRLRAVFTRFRASDRRVRMVIRAESTASVAEIAAMLPRIATISIPPVTDREAEFERVLEAYGMDAVAELDASWLGFRPGDPELVLTSGIATLDELEDVARKLVALRNWGVTDGAKRLGISHSSLSRWARRRKLSV